MIYKNISIRNSYGPLLHSKVTLGPWVTLGHRNKNRPDNKDASTTLYLLLAFQNSDYVMEHEMKS